MSRLNEDQTIQYLYRSYAAVDGLWFMKIEEKFGLTAALDTDSEVWQIMAKIQSRWLRKLLAAPDGLTGLADCLTNKLRIDGFEFSLPDMNIPNEFDVVIRRCPWLELLKKSGREHLANQIGEKVCRAEYEAWAAEFGPDIRFETMERICAGDDYCILRFKSR